MNSIETFVYNLVRKNPAVKQLVRNIYQNFFDILPKENNYYKNPLTIKENYFFGFHDISPWNSDETKLLAHGLQFDLRMPKQGEKIDIGFFKFVDGRIGNFVKLGESKAWNYHKGARLQWLDNNRVIFNTYDGNKLCACIIETSTKTKQIIDLPIDSIFCNDKVQLATSFSYQRLERCMPGYGYPYSDDSFLEENASDKTGLFIIDITKNKTILSLSLERIADTCQQQKNDDMLHFVTHTEFSKDGKYISFLYRRIPIHGNYMKRWTMIMIYDIENDKLWPLQSEESGSHYVWNDKNEIVASCFMNGKSCHVLFNLDGSINKLIVPDVLNQDGHQSFIDNIKFVTDTYPDKKRMAKLIEVNIENNEVQTIARLYSPKKFQTKDFKCHIACDLHPRISPSGKYICFDTPTTGKRSLAVMSV